MADDHCEHHHHHDHEHGEEEGLIVLTDENGQDHQFEIIDVIEVEQKEYAILVPAEGETSEEEEGEAVILRLETDAEGEEVLVDIEDDQEWERVAGAWEALLEEEEEDEE